jgi:5-(carboxyamino)imidazole ribonucleotide synthase
MGIISKKVGILGGGQLGKMLCHSAQPWHLDISILDKSKDFPAAPYCTKFVEGDFRDYDDVLNFGRTVDVLTIEIEAVNQEALEKLEKEGVEIKPQPEILATIRDKGKQADFYASHGIKAPVYRSYHNSDQIKTDIQSNALNFPFVQKLRTEGYDGRGVAAIRSAEDLTKIMEGPSICQDMIDIEKELAIIVARNIHGEEVTYDPVEMVFHPVANLLEYQLCPANIAKETAELLKKTAYKIAREFDLVGIMAIEFFLDKGGEVWVNEAAPRPHNSGHHTIETCECSQYEQLLRAVLDLPLGSTRLTDSSVMINLLGEKGKTGLARIEGIEEVMNTAGAHLHLYGKSVTKPFRKMGHILISGEDPNSLIKKGLYLKDNVKITA